MKLKSLLIIFALVMIFVVACTPRKMDVTPKPMPVPDGQANGEDIIPPSDTTEDVNPEEVDAVTSDLDNLDW